MHQLMHSMAGLITIISILIMLMVLVSLVGLLVNMSGHLLLVYMKIASITQTVRVLQVPPLRHRRSWEAIISVSLETPTISGHTRSIPLINYGMGSRARLLKQAAVRLQVCHGLVQTMGAASASLIVLS